LIGDALDVGEERSREDLSGWWIGQCLRQPGHFVDAARLTAPVCPVSGRMVAAETSAAKTLLDRDRRSEEDLFAVTGPDGIAGMRSNAVLSFLGLPPVAAMTSDYFVNEGAGMPRKRSLAVGDQRLHE